MALTGVPTGRGGGAALGRRRMKGTPRGSWPRSPGESAETFGDAARAPVSANNHVPPVVSRRSRREDTCMRRYTTCMRPYTMMNRVARSLGVAGIALAAVVGVIAFGSTDAAAQGFNNVEFQCVAGADLSADLRGLGNTNVCIVKSVAVETDCACASKSGNCPTDTKKQTFTSASTTGLSVEPKNGRINDTFDAGPAAGVCTVLQPDCGTGQTAQAVNQDIAVAWVACTTDVPAGGACTCGDPPVSDFDPPASVSSTTDPDCSESTTPFPGKHDSCKELFP
jgi:hypothetical protein